MVPMNDTHYDFYASGPFFDPEQTASMERMEQALEGAGGSVFKPRLADRIEDAEPEECFAAYIGGIRDSRALIANLMDEDPGTVFEIGYAHALGKPVYGYLEGLTPMDRVNLMIGQAVEAVFAGPEDLRRWLETGEHEEVDYIRF